MDWVLLTFAGAGSLFGQIGMSLAYKYGDTSIVTPILYLMIVINFLFDAIVMKYKFSTIELVSCLVLTILILPPSII